VILPSIVYLCTTVEREDSITVEQYFPTGFGYPSLLYLRRCNSFSPLIARGAPNNYRGTLPPSDTQNANRVRRWQAGTQERSAGCGALCYETVPCIGYLRGNRSQRYLPRRFRVDVCKVIQRLPLGSRRTRGIYVHGGGATRRAHAQPKRPRKAPGCPGVKLRDRYLRRGQWRISLSRRHLLCQARQSLLRRCLTPVLTTFLTSPAPIPKAAPAKQDYQDDYNNERRCVHASSPFPSVAIRYVPPRSPAQLRQ
jgi:hypothetical protein